MPRQQTPDQQQKGRTNPGTFSPDDDEAQEADRTHASDMPQQSEQRQAQDDRRRRPEENIEQIEEEEAEEDEDESDHISERP
jgi:hypothetical protein